MWKLILCAVVVLMSIGLSGCISYHNHHDRCDDDRGGYYTRGPVYVDRGDCDHQGYHHWH